MADWILDPIRDGISQRAMLELVLLGVLCGPLGVWVVLYRRSYATESIAHAMLPGLVVASLLSIPLGVGAAAGLGLATGLIAIASRRSDVGADVAVAVTVTTLFGLGTLLALAPEVPVRLGEILFGDPLAVSDGELAASAVLVLAGVITLSLGNRTLLVSGFDAASSHSLGFSPARAEIVLAAVLAATVLVAVQALGNLLVVAIVVAPAAAALRLQARLLPALGTAAALAVAAGIAGIYLSFHADVAAGASIALCALAIYALAALLARIRTSPSGDRRVRSEEGAHPADLLPASPATDVGPAAS